MKTIKYIFSFLVIALFTGCAEDDNDLSFVDSVVAPSNVSALFQPTQDNSGLVTIIPNSDGAVSYNVTLGDGSDPVTIITGENIEKVYAEGNYTVEVEAVGLTGLKTSITQDLVVSFKAPENLVVTIENDPAISKQVNVTATADFAMSYQVYFGEAGNDDPILANIGEVASYNYQDAGTYTIRVVAMGAAIATTEYTEEFEVTEILQPIVSAPTQPTRDASDVISIFSEAYTDITDTDFDPNWGQATQYVAFDLNGDMIIQYTNLNYQGIDIGENIDASSMESLHIDIWTADATSIDIYPLPMDVQAADERFVTEALVAGEWNSFDIPLTDFTDQGLPIDNLKQFKFVGSGTVFIDNIYIYRAPSVQTQPIIPVGFESPTFDYGIFSFGGSSFEPIPAAIIDNPDPSGINTTEKVFQVEKPSGAQVWAGAGIVLAGGTDFSEGTTIEVDVWSPTANTPILFKMEDSSSPPDGNGNPSVFVEVIVSTTVTNQWETLSFDLTIFGDFSTSNSYDRAILFPNFNNGGTGSTYYFDNIRISGATLQAPTIPLNFESTLFDFGIFGFGGPNFEPIPAAIISNPDMNGINTSGKVFEIEKPSGAQVWAGAGIVLAGGTDFTNGTTVEVDVWSPTANTPILFKMEDSNSPPDGNGNPSVFVEVIVSTTVANQWETLSFDLTTFDEFDTSNAYDRAILFPNFNNGGTGSTYYFDNIRLTN